MLQLVAPLQARSIAIPMARGRERTTEPEHKPQERQTAQKVPGSDGGAPREIYRARIQA